MEPRLWVVAGCRRDRHVAWPAPRVTTRGAGRYGAGELPRHHGDHRPQAWVSTSRLRMPNGPHLAYLAHSDPGEALRDVLALLTLIKSDLLLDVWSHDLLRLLESRGVPSMPGGVTWCVMYSPTAPAISHAHQWG